MTMIAQAPINEIIDPSLWREFGLAGMVILCLFLCNVGLIWYIGKVIDKVTERQDATVDKIDARHDETIRSIDQKHREDMNMMQKESWRVQELTTAAIDKTTAAIDRLSDTMGRITER